MKTCAPAACKNCLYSQNHLGTEAEARQLREILKSIEQPFYCHEYSSWELGKTQDGVVCANYAKIKNLELGVEKSAPTRIGVGLMKGRPLF